MPRFPFKSMKERSPLGSTQTELAPLINSELAIFLLLEGKARQLPTFASLKSGRICQRMKTKIPSTAVITSTRPANEVGHEPVEKSSVRREAWKRLGTASGAATGGGVSVAGMREMKG
jgi:hypothetical protein